MYACLPCSVQEFLQFVLNIFLSLHSFSAPIFSLKVYYFDSIKVYYLDCIYLNISQSLGLGGRTDEPFRSD